MVKLVCIAIVSLYTMLRVDGQSKVKVLADGDSPKFNRQGTKIVYRHNGKIWTMSVTGKNKRQIGHAPEEVNASWSPDGSKLVYQFQGVRDTSYQLFVMNSDGSNPHRLLKQSSMHDSIDIFPLWSPDGKNIVFSHGSQLWIVDTSGEYTQPLTKEPEREFEYMGDWSPNGKLIAYLRVDHNSGQPRIWLMMASGDGQAIFLQGITVKHAKWSNDAKFLYYGDNYSVWKIDVEGKNPAKKVFECGHDQNILSWDISNDEKSIVYDWGAHEDESSVYLAPLNEGDKLK